MKNGLVKTKLAIGCMQANYGKKLPLHKNIKWETLRDSQRASPDSTTTLGLKRRRWEETR